MTCATAQAVHSSIQQQWCPLVLPCCASANKPDHLCGTRFTSRAALPSEFKLQFRPSQVTV